MASGPVGVIGFLVVTILWLAFGAALVLSPGILHNLWQSLRALRLPVQMIVWALLLPWVLGLWICLCSWPSWLRLLLVVGLGIATVGVFFPRQQQGLVAL